MVRLDIYTVFHQCGSVNVLLDYSPLKSFSCTLRAYICMASDQCANVHGPTMKKGKSAYLHVLIVLIYKMIPSALLQIFVMSIYLNLYPEKLP